MDVVSKLIRQRNQALAIAASTFFLWQGGLLATDIVALLELETKLVKNVIVFTVLVGALGWVVSSVLFLNYASKLGQSKKQAVLQDEMYSHTQRLSLQIGFAAVMLGVSIFLALDMFYTFPVSIVTRSLLILGVVSPLLTFVLLNREDPEEAE